MLIDGISVGMVLCGGKLVPHEIKKSRKVEKAHYYQLL